MFGLFLKQKTKQVKEIRDIQEQSTLNDQDDYMIGMFNGLELAVSILEDREPKFMYCVNEQEVKKEEKTEVVGRTIASGVIRR